MAKIAYILLCHKDPKAIIAQAERLTATGDYIAIHFDASADPKDFKAIQDALGDNRNVAFARKRISCGWGEWSLVQASLYAVEAAEDRAGAAKLALLRKWCSACYLMDADGNEYHDIASVTPDALAAMDAPLYQMVHVAASEAFSRKAQLGEARGARSSSS